MDIANIIGNPEGPTLEYKAVLPPSRNIAKILSSFANTNGGILILGAKMEPSQKMVVNGLSTDFHVNSIIHKAIDLLNPKPIVEYDYHFYQGKSLFVICVQKSTIKVSAEGRFFKRIGNKTEPETPTLPNLGQINLAKINSTNDAIERNKESSTGAKLKLSEHYQSVLTIINDLQRLLYPNTATEPTTIPEGKILMRILFSSCADSFELYLTDLLYEIYLANPATLKSEGTVTLKEVLNCADMQEFINYVAKKKLSKLQRGSIKGFLKDNAQISDLNVISDTIRDKIEGILQTRHLYAHRNGIIDEKFLAFCPGQYSLNQEHLLSVDEMLDNLLYLDNVAKSLDSAAVQKYSLDIL